MATLDDSPTLFSGQSWSYWLDKAKTELSEESCPDDTPTTEDPKGDSMKLRKEDIALYGLCPARDEFYLVVCECCGQVIKPQALKTHLEQRHNVFTKNHCSNKTSPSASSTSSQSPTKTSVPTSTSTSTSHSKDHRHTQNAHKPTKRPNNNAPPQLHPKDKPPEVSKCKRTAMVKVERIEPGHIKRQPPTLPKCSPAKDSKASGENRDGKVISGKLNAVEKRDANISVSKAHTHNVKTLVPVIKKREDGHMPPTTSVVTTICPSAPVTTASSAVSMATAVITSPLVTAVTSMAPRMTPSLSISTSSTKTVMSTLASTAHRDVQKAATWPASVTVTSVTATEKKSHSSAHSALTSTTSVVKTSTKPVLSTQISSGSTGSGKRGTTRKTPLCKDREYDANKHCGAWIEDLQRQCTRSLTCKTHSLSLRRAVSGRVKSFDELLREHREAKEALLLKTKGEGTSSSLQHSSSMSKSTVKPSAASTQSKSAPSTPISTIPLVFKSPVETKIAVPIVSPSPPVIKPQLAVKEKLCLSSSIARQSSMPVFPKNDPVSMPESLSYLSSDGEEEEDDLDRTDYPCLSHHPRPAAVNSFGSWRHGNGSCVFNRKEDLCRSAFFAAVERHLHPPPHKKLCVESNLPKGSTISTNTRDPYDFTFGDGSHGNQRMANLACRLVSKAVAKTIKPGVGNSPPSCNSKTGFTTVTSPSNSMWLSSFEFSDNAVSSATNSLQSPPSSKRKRSGSSPITPNIANVNNGNGTTIIGSSSGGSSLGMPVPCTSPIAITIPASINFNLSSSTLSNLNATLANATVRNKSTIKDIGKIYMDGGAQMNGQLVNISGSNLAEMTHIQLNSLSERCAKAKSNKGANRVQQGSQHQSVIGKMQLNKSPPARGQHKTSPILSCKSSAPNSLSVTPVIGSVGVGGFLHLETQLSNSVSGSTMTLTTSTSGGSSDSISSTQDSPVQLSSPVLLSGSSSPTSPPNGMLSPTNPTGKFSSAGNHGNYLHEDDGLTTNINLTLTEQLLAQHSSGISITPAKPENVLSRSMSAGSLRGASPGQVGLSPAAATAQQLAAAALNLNTQSGCLLTTNNSVPQLYATHMLAKSSPTTQLGSLQLQARPGLKTIGGLTSKVPIQPLSLTILGPGNSVPSNQHQQSHLLLHAAEEAHTASNLS